jgi:hypothetical protein
LAITGKGREYQVKTQLGLTQGKENAEQTVRGLMGAIVEKELEKREKKAEKKAEAPKKRTPRAKKSEGASKAKGGE